MPPRFAYWTIVAGGLPTAFRAAERDDLMPTFLRIKQTQPDAEMKYFARGKLWASADEARQAAERGRRSSQPLRGQGRGDRQAGERRGPDWRPGGDHRDPRQPFKDAKKARNLVLRRARWEHKQRGDRPGAGPLRKPGTSPQEDRGGKTAAAARRPPKHQHGRPRFETDRSKDRERQQGTRPDGIVPRERTRRPSGPKGALRPKPGRLPYVGAGNEAPQPSKPPGPNREPRPGSEPPPEPAPRPSEPEIKPPGPPERGGYAGGRRPRRHGGKE